MENINELLIRRKNKYFISNESSDKNKEQVQKVKTIGTLLVNLQAYDYTLSDKFIKLLLNISLQQISIIGKDIINIVLQHTGEDLNHKVMYPNFPKQVMEASEAELFINAVLHYFTVALSDINIIDNDSIYLPQYSIVKRPQLSDQQTLKKYKIIDFTDNINEIINIGMNLITSKSSISMTDRNDLFILMKNFPVQFSIKIRELNKKTFITKENAAIVSAAIILINSQYKRIAYFSDFFDLVYKNNKSNVNDILRVITVLSDFKNNDASLSTNVKFINFSRKIRKLLIKYIDDIIKVNGMNKNLSEAKIYLEKWKRINEKLHFSDYKQHYHLAFSFINNLLNKTNKIKTNNAKLEIAINECDINKIDIATTENPGLFVRNLDRILRNYYNNGVAIISDIIELLFIINKKIKQTSTKVLFAAYSHFITRDRKYRTFMPKGNISKIQVIENSLSDIPSTWIKTIIDYISRELNKRLNGFKQYVIDMNNTQSKSKNIFKSKYIYLDKSLKKYTVPLNLRNQNKSTLKQYGRSSIVGNIENIDILRLFVNWHNINLKNNTLYNRVDIDLSVVFFNNDWKYIDHCSYTKLRNKFATHSGDITTAPEGASEFVDINLKSLLQELNSNVKYIVPIVLSYTQQTFKQINNVKCGWMERENTGQQGEIFESKLVENKIDLTQNTAINVPLVININNKNVIYADIGYNKSIKLNNVENQQTLIASIGKYIVECPQLTLYKLFSFHLAGNNYEETSNVQKADIILIDSKENLPEIEDFELRDNQLVITAGDFDIINKYFL